MTRPRKKIRLGVGAVVPDGPNEAARDYLLAAITKRCPDMVDALAAIAEGALDERQARRDNWSTDWRCSDPWLVQVARATTVSPGYETTALSRSRSPTRRRSVA